jgi:multiple sugar transport system substrate-binding protein
MSTKKILKGITWNHSRGFTSVVATAQRFTELYPDVDIIWEKRSLQQFADMSIQQLAEKYDLLVIDHPWAGFAAGTKSILPLDDYLPAAFIKDQEENSVGRSYESYNFKGKQWALAIDAATPVASSRPDLLAQQGLSLPKTFDDVLALADKGLVACALIPIDVLMAFYGFCATLGENPCLQDDIVISAETGTKALQLFKSLSDRIDRSFFDKNPIQVYETMVNTNQIAYCPFAYGYSNYSRNGYAANLLHFHDTVRLEDYGHLITSLGGTGLAVSSSSKYIHEAVKYAEFTAQPNTQEFLFFDNGGQPGHLKAWESEHTNNASHQYFKNTLPTLQRAYLRPRYQGHMYFQDHAGDIVRNYLLNGGNEKAVLGALNELYIQSKNLEKA